MTMSDQDLAGFGVQVTHHFAGGTYVKESHIPKGIILGQHSHDHDHLSSLSKGKVIVTEDGVPRVVRAPAVMTIKAGVQHMVEALEDSVWLCIWATDETDPQKVDASVLEG